MRIPLTGTPLPTRSWRVRAASLAAIAAAGGLAACGSAAAPGNTTPAAAAVTAPLATSVDTTRDSWAIVPMSANPAFWEVFARPAKSAAWQLVTPPGIADNGGLVAAASGGTITVAVRPNQGLTFSPLARTGDGGKTWSTGLIDADVAATPGALAADGRLLVLLGNGTILESSDAGNTWRTLARQGAIADSPAGRNCGVVGVGDVSFGISTTEVLAAGTCGTAGTTGIFSYSAGAWQRVSLPVSGRVVRMTGKLMLLQSGPSLLALWRTGPGWSRSASLAAGAVAGSGSLAGGGAWVLLAGRRAAIIAGPGRPWRSLPTVPPRTAVLAAGPGDAVDALAVSGSKLTVWRLAGSATVWSNIQTINVPLQYGSSG